MVFTARQLQEKCQEQHCDLYSAFIDLTKAFDTVSREGLWKIMAKYGCPKKFITIVRQLHDEMQARVQENRELSNLAILYQTELNKGVYLHQLCSV